MNDEKKTKAPPRTSEDYDLEIATMKQCKKLIKRLPPYLRAGVVKWLEAAVQDAAATPPMPPKPPDPRQADLFAE